MSTFPALKPGVTYVIEHHADYSSIAVGTSNFGIRLSGHAAILFIQKANGQIELNDLLFEIGISNGQALEILQPLLTHNLLSLLTSPTFSKPDQVDDFATKVALARVLPELNAIGWRNGLNPAREIKERESKSILILGSNRLALALFELFLSTGYLNTSLKTYSNTDISRDPIGADLIGATAFRLSDIGQPFDLSKDRISKELALKVPLVKQTMLSSSNTSTNSDSNSAQFASSSSTSSDSSSPLFHSNSNAILNAIIINTSDFQPDQIVDLALDGAAHLQVGNLTAGKVEVGPIVIPGRTPCYNCISLWKSEKMANLAKLKIAHLTEKPLELPAAGVTYLSGLIVTLVDSYFALNKSFLIGSSVVINLLKPLEYLERFWQPNPKCGCLELL